MGYYEIYGADDFEFPSLVDDSYYEKLTWLENRATIDFGDKPMVKLCKGDWRHKAKKADFPPYGTDFLFMRDYVYEKDREFYEPFGVFFHVYTTKRDKLYIFNCDILENALDEEKSEFTRFSSGKIMMVDKYVFNESIPPETTMFRLPYAGRSIIVKDEFVEYYNSNNYTGLQFKKLA